MELSASAITTSALAEEACAYILGRGHVTFVELLDRFPEMRGDSTFAYQSSNVVLWTGISQHCYDALNLLLKSNRIHLWRASTLTYLVDGGALKLPLATSRRPYKRPHWLPVTFHGEPKRGNRQASGRTTKARR